MCFNCMCNNGYICTCIKNIVHLHCPMAKVNTATLFFRILFSSAITLIGSSPMVGNPSDKNIIICSKTNKINLFFWRSILQNLIYEMKNKRKFKKCPY